VPLPKKEVNYSSYACPNPGFDWLSAISTVPGCSFSVTRHFKGDLYYLLFQPIKCPSGQERSYGNAPSVAWETALLLRLYSLFVPLLFDSE